MKKGRNKMKRRKYFLKKKDSALSLLSFFLKNYFNLFIFSMYHNYEFYEIFLIQDTSL